MTQKPYKTGLTTTTAWKPTQKPTYGLLATARENSAPALKPQKRHGKYAGTNKKLKMAVMKPRTQKPMAPHTHQLMTPHTQKPMAPHTHQLMTLHTQKLMAPHTHLLMAPHTHPLMAPHTHPLRIHAPTQMTKMHASLIRRLTSCHCLVKASLTNLVQTDEDWKE